MKFNYLLLVSITVAFCVSCERSVGWEIFPGHDNRLVVGAILTNTVQTQEVRLSMSFDTLNAGVTPVVDATVTVSAGQTTYSFEHDVQTPGLYKSTVPFAVVSQLEYVLNIAWEESEYFAVSTLSDVAPIPDIRFEQADSAGNFTVSDHVVPVFNESQQAMYQFDLDWSHLQPEGRNRARLYFYTFNTIHISEFLPPDREDVIFPKGTIAVITKYGLNDEYAAYLRSVVIETQWNGNWFYGNPENQPGNISHGALGFFACCAVLQDTLIVQ